MRRKLQGIDKDTGDVYWVYEVVNPKEIKWSGQHFFIHIDVLAWHEEKKTHVPYYVMTHIGTGNKMFLPVSDLDRLIEIASDVDTWDVNWGAVRAYARDCRIHDGYVPVSEDIEAFEKRVKPYFDEIYHLD